MISIVRITYGIHPFMKNGLPVNSGQPENFVETRSQKVNTGSNMIICFTIPPKLIELIKESFLLQEFRFLKRGENDSESSQSGLSFLLN
jgi:hypothetical protein